MRLYLVQHGEAKAKAEDPERPLTERGAETVQRMAAWASRMQLKVNQIRHSGKKRAQQTAAILAQSLSPTEGVVATTGLDPKDGVRPVAKTLQDASEAVMLVGHLPFLNRLASLLLTDDPERDLICFQYAGIVCLERQERKWSLDWAVPPSCVETTTTKDQPG